MKITEKQQKVVDLKNAGLTFADIAKKLDVTRENVGALYKKAMKTLSHVPTPGFENLEIDDVGIKIANRLRQNGIDSKEMILDDLRYGSDVLHFKVVHLVGPVAIERIRQWCGAEVYDQAILDGQESSKKRLST